MDERKFIKSQFEACMTGGAMGDAWGSSFENQTEADTSKTFFWAQPKEKEREWAFTDDTQLTMATCEALCLPGPFNPASLANHIVRYYNEKRLTGIGASTLKAIRELQVGGHWSQVGRSGEYGAGNGAAMRIAPFAFFKEITRENVRDACRITHRNDEAYVGALAIYLSLKAILSGAWNGENNLFNLIIPELPDTSVRDRLIDISNARSDSDITAIAQLGNNGYVVNSIPFAIFAATQVLKIGFQKMYSRVIDAGGDTDTNASLAGQIAGTLVGFDHFPDELLTKLEKVNKYEWVQSVIAKTKNCIE